MPTDINPPLANGAYAAIAVYNGIKIKEISGRSGTDSFGGSTAERTWKVWGTPDPLAARAALVDGPVLINEFDGKNIESLAYEASDERNAWELTASYNATTPKTGSYTISIDTTGSTVLQTYAIDQTAFPATGKTATDFGNALNVQNGIPQGIQRVIPSLKITVRAKIAKAYVTSPIAYSKLIARLTGTTNQAAAFGSEFAPGELLFLGASGDVVTEEPTLAFHFLASENVTGLTIGDIAGITKAGHQLLWFDYQPDKDPTSKRLKPMPIAAHVGTVYGPSDLDVLKIGVP